MRLAGHFARGQSRACQVYAGWQGPRHAHARGPCKGRQCTASAPASAANAQARHMRAAPRAPWPHACLGGPTAQVCSKLWAQVRAGARGKELDGCTGTAVFQRTAPFGRQQGHAWQYLPPIVAQQRGLLPLRQLRAQGQRFSCCMPSRTAMVPAAAHSHGQALKDGCPLGKLNPKFAEWKANNKPTAAARAAGKGKLTADHTQPGLGGWALWSQQRCKRVLMPLRGSVLLS